MKNGTMWIILIVGIVLVVLMLPKNDNWEDAYKKMIQEKELDSYTKETNIYDYSDEELQKIIKDLKRKSNNEEQAMRNVMNYVRNNMYYHDFAYCSDFQKSSELLEVGQGNCVHMSKVAIALLRGMGIAARPAGGCLNERAGICTGLFAIIPQYPQVPDEKVIDYQRRGWLHQWVQVYLPEKGWINADATIASFYDLTCNMFTISDYRMSCQENNLEFAKQCYAS